MRNYSLDTAKLFAHDQIYTYHVHKFIFIITSVEQKQNGVVQCLKYFNFNHFINYYNENRF